MTALGAWLKQLVMVVLLAVFADLLLPTKSMQKYVRVVMGLAVIAVILQPLAPLFRGDWTERLADYATEMVLGDATSGSPNGTADDLGATLQRQQDQQANQLVTEQLRRQMAQDLDCTPVSIQIHGVRQGTSAIVADVELSPADSDRAGEVRSWLAQQLGVAEAQVNVRTTAGR
jgi:stage III sporulation protein AF